MNKRCDTCRHWYPPVFNQALGYCKLLSNDGEGSPMAGMELGVEKSQIAENNGDYGYGAVLSTAAEFYCAGHEEKP